jgi:esterase/lipase
MNGLKTFGVVTIVLMVIYLLGPSPRKPLFDKNLPIVPQISELDSYIQQKESCHHLKKDNEAKIVWANDSSKIATEYAIVYLHGFSASQEEGNPIHRNIAKAFGCNLYLSRLADHGIDTTEQLINLTPDNYWESAKEALMIGKKLGKKVILMGTSTGGSLALQLAANYPNDIAGLILYSPNIKIYDKLAFLLNNPWGLQIARMVKKGNYQIPNDKRPIYKAYWNTPYRLESLVSLEEYIENTMNKTTFKAVHQPALILYYYKDELHQDNVVNVSAILEMGKQLATPESQKIIKPIPNAGDHVIGSPIKSNDPLTVQSETELFLSHILKMKEIKKN